jgi:hypothetical protein
MFPNSSDLMWDFIWNILKAAGVAIVLFLIFREVVTWYWKQNEIVDLLKEIRDNTREKGKGEEKREIIDASVGIKENKKKKSFSVQDIVIVVLAIAIFVLLFLTLKDLNGR